MPRFVLLYHACPKDFPRPSHWDFMLETGGALRTWALPQLPHAWAAWQARTSQRFPDCPPLGGFESVLAEQLADHRLDYLDLEGPLSGNRGEVLLIARGTYASGANAPEVEQITLASGDWEGSLQLRQSADDGAQWTVTIVRPSG